MDDPLDNMDRSEIEIQRKLMDDKLGNGEEEIIMYIMPFELMIGDYDGPKFEQSKLRIAAWENLNLN
jgi:hypothetical protein